jgi:hypothetical protein
LLLPLLVQMFYPSSRLGTRGSGGNRQFP